MKKQDNYVSLDDLIDATVLKRLCTVIYCSTCGAYYFRQEVANFLAARMGVRSWKTSPNSGSHSLTTPQLIQLVEELRSVNANRPKLGHFDRIQPIRFLIKDVWNNADEETRDQWMLEVLKGTYAGEIYEGMLAHYKKDLQRWADEKERYSPEGIARRLEEKIALRDERLRLRAIQKVEIDKIWRSDQKQEGII